MNLRQKILFKILNFWPPFLGAGIHIDYIARDFREIKVSMKLVFWNRNYVNTQFGGSLYSMTDPFYMLMLINNLGHDYIVWDKAASIRFKKPGKSKVFATFKLSHEQIEEIKSQLEEQSKVEPVFMVEVVDLNGEVIAQVEKKIYVRKKRPSDN